MLKVDITCLVSGSDTDGKMAVFEEIVAPGSGPPRHTHRDQLEIFHIIEGSLKFELNGVVSEAGAGATVMIPAGAVHAFQNIGAASARIHFELLPAGDSKEAFERLVTGDRGNVEAFFDRYGMDLSGPPLGTEP